MRELILKLFAKPYDTSMELHNDYKCWLSIYHPSETAIEGFRKFFDHHGFLIAHNMFDENWDQKIKLEEIYKKLLLVYNFDPKSKDIMIVYESNKKVYFTNGYYVFIPPRGIFVYDKSRVKVIY